MADEPQVTLPNNEPSKADPPPNNAAEARNPDGSLKDTPSPTPEKKTEQTDESKAKDEPKKDEPKKDDKPALTGAPDKYEPFKAPEGLEFDAEAVSRVTELFKELNLSQEGGQRLMDMYAAELIKAAEAPYEAYVDTRKEWREELAKDKVLGNGVDDLKPEVKKAFSDMIGSLPPELGTAFKEAMVVTGAGDHPAFNRAFFEFSKAFSEGKPVKAGGPAATGPNAQKSGAQTLYPNLPSEHSQSTG